MRNININISKAQLMSFSVELKENKAEIIASIGLFSDSGKCMSTYSISSDHYDKKNKFDIPPSMVGPITEIMKELEIIVVRHCMGVQGQLPEGAVRYEDVPF